MNLTNTTGKNYLFQKTFLLFLMACGLLISPTALRAQFTFMGDYDKTFAAPKGYYVDPEQPDPSLPPSSTYNAAGDIMPDGSVIAAGRIFNGQNWELFLRKLTPLGTIDNSFGTNGFVRHSEFYVIDINPRQGLTNESASSLTPGFMPDGSVKATSFNPSKVIALPTNRFLVIGICEMDGIVRFPSNGTTLSSPIIGKGICMMRFHANGTLDTSFGTAGDFTTGGAGAFGFLYREVPGMVWTPIGSQPNINYTAEIENLDAVVQPDGKILIAGTSRIRFQVGSSDEVVSGFLVRFTGQGARDATFGESGAIHHFDAQQQPNACTPRTRFFGVAIQPDNRILALGSRGTVDTADCNNRHGNRFYVARFLSNGQFETARHLDGAAPFNFQRERAVSAVLTRDASKVIVSGAYDCKATMVRFNLSDLSIDTTFGTNGIRGYAQFCGVSTAPYSPSLFLEAIQPDGKILGADETGNHRIVRFNADGSADHSFGNQPLDGSATGGGRLAVNVTHYNGAVNPLVAIPLLRPNGKINLVGTSAAHAGLGITRAVVSQQNTVFKNGNYTDFTGDGKSEIAVYRPSDGVWHQLNSQNNNYSAVKWGLASDKLAPADYDGDGRTDMAVYRDGTWFIRLSANGQIRYVNFGLAGDSPRPGDFDGDGLADISVFRPSNGTWYRLNSSNGQFAAVQFGASGDVPVLGDYDADGRTDFTVFRPSNGVWYIFRSSDNEVRINAFGLSGDIPLSGDFNGDSRSDLAVFRPSDRTWYIARPDGVPAYNFDSIPFGIASDTPVPADYDNDGKTDVAVYRNGAWWIYRSGNNDTVNITFGLSSDKPVAASYLP